MRRWNSLFLVLATTPMLIGGQAVVEGVMMKSKHHVATAVRTEKGKVLVRHRKTKSFAERTGINKIPLLRGAFILYEMMIIGLRELNWSANQAAGEKEELSSWALAFMMILSIVFALALFKLLPLFLASFITGKTGGGNWTLNILDGVMKFLIFVIYMVLIGFLPDIKRLFQYHGAEHKSVNCYEAGKKLTPKNAKPLTLKQPRCGTTFVAYVFVISILVYAIIPFGSTFWVKYLLRIALLPVIAGIAYEWIRFSGKYYYKSSVIRAISAPGMAVQALTLREPTLKQLEVGIAALQRVLKEEKKISR